jgi:hypothetical protein
MRARVHLKAAQPSGSQNTAAGGGKPLLEDVAQQRCVYLDSVCVYVHVVCLCSYMNIWSRLITCAHMWKNAETTTA